MRQARCEHCGGWFAPDRYNRHHQRYCGSADCRRARERQRQARHRQRHGPEAAYRLREAARQRQRRLLAAQLPPPPGRPRPGLAVARAVAPFAGVVATCWPLVLLGWLGQVCGSESGAEVRELLTRCEERGRRLAGLPGSPRAAAGA